MADSPISETPRQATSLPDPVPGGDMPSGEMSDERLLIRVLYNEQLRLRSELDEIRHKQTGDQGQKKSNDGSGSGGGKDKKQGGEQDGTNQKGDDEGDGQGEGKKDEKKDDQQGEKKGDEKDEKQGEEKAPLWQRVTGWVKAHPVKAALFAAGFVVLLIAGFFLWRYLSSYESTDDAFVDGHTDPISPRISGIVIGSYVENTYRVKKGEVLVELDPRDYEVALAQARSQVAQAEAAIRAQTPNVPITQTSQSSALVNAQLGVTSAAANLTAAQEKYRAAQADLEQAEANEANAAREEERYRRLVVKQEVSRELYDQRATDQREMAAVVASRRETAEAAAKAVAQAEASLGQSREQVDEAKHNLPRQIAVQSQTLAMRTADADAAKARADQAQLNLTYTKIVAPADGIVGDKSVELGSQVAAGQELLAVTETGDIWVTANFKETEIRNMRPGESVSIHVDALSQTFDGYVEALPGASGAVYSLLPPENATGNYVKVVQRLPVRIRFKPNQKGAERLAPGMSVEPKVWIR